MATNTPRECGVCHEMFDEGERCPRILPCYHHFCTDCINQLIKNTARMCPYCRNYFEANDARDIRIDHGVLDCIIYMSQQDSNSGATNNLMKETEDVTSNVLNVCRDVNKLIYELLEDMLVLKSKCSQARDTIKDVILLKLGDILANNERCEQECISRRTRLIDFQQELKEKENQLLMLKSKLRTPPGSCYTEDAAIRDDVEEVNASVSEWVESLKEVLSEGRLMCSTAEKEIKLTTTITDVVKKALCLPKNYAKLELSPTTASLSCREERMSASSVSSSDEDTDVFPHFGIINLPSYAPQPTTSMLLQEMNERVKRLVEEGMVFAVQQCRNRRRYGRITLRDSKLHLHILREGPPPPNVITILHSDLMSLVNPSSRLTFVDLGVDESTLGRMYIGLNPDTQGAQNFTLLCTGEKGPSYLNTKLLRVQAKGSNREAVLGGDYQFNSGRGGKTLSAGLDLAEQEYKRDWAAGAVRGFSYDLFGQFYINTRDCPGAVCHGTFGKVVEGLPFLTDAISQYPDIRQITIKDCGIVLPYYYLGTP